MGHVTPDFTEYIQDMELPETHESLEIHRCPHCHGVFGIDWTYLDQVDERITCMMCGLEVSVSDP